VFHDTKTQTAAMLPALLRALRSRHYRVVHIVPASQQSATAPAPMSKCGISVSFRSQSA
jgi:peptidoglycan-N-acetylglucosamine deacetylase